MAEQKTLLAHLAPRLGSSTENIAVEALGHILSSSKAALREIEDVLKTGGAEVGTISPDVQTQASDEEGTRPDHQGDGRLTLQEVRSSLQPLQQDDPLGIIDRSSKLLVPINLPVGVEYEAVCDAVVKRLEDIARLIDSADTTS